MQDSRQILGSSLCCIDRRSCYGKKSSLEDVQSTDGKQQVFWDDDSEVWGMHACKGYAKTFAKKRGEELEVFRSGGVGAQDRHKSWFAECRPKCGF